MILISLRDYAYSFVSVVMKHRTFYSYPIENTVPALLDNSLSMKTGHMVLLLRKILKPLTSNCPLDMIPRLIPLIVPTICGMFDKLNEEWIKISDKSRPSI